MYFLVCGQLPTRTIPHSRSTGIGPDEWFYWLVVALVGICASVDCGAVLGIMVLVGNSCALFNIWWGVVLEPYFLYNLQT